HMKCLSVLSIIFHFYFLFFFFFTSPAPTEIYTLSLHDALPISGLDRGRHVHSGRSRISRTAAEQVYPAPPPNSSTRSPGSTDRVVTRCSRPSAQSPAPTCPTVRPYCHVVTSSATPSRWWIW